MGTLESVIKNQTIRLTALYQSPVRVQSNTSEALIASVELARICEKAGCHRYSLTQHYSKTLSVLATPKILVTQIALRSELGIECFFTRIADLRLLLVATGSPTEAFKHITVSTRSNNPPEPRLLGSSN